MYSYKRFFWSVVGGIGALVFLSFLTWYFATSKVLSGHPGIGDLARMGYLPELVKLDKQGELPGGKHLEYWEYTGQPVDIVTMGDSFSNGYGQNYYQDYIVGRHGVTVLNLSEIFWYPNLTNRFDPVVNLLNEGLFDRIKPRYLLIQNVERFGDYLAKDVGWKADGKAVDYLSFLADRKEKSVARPAVAKGFFNMTWLKYLANLVTYNFFGHDYKSVVFKSDLKQELFTSDSKNELACLQEDLSWSQKETARIAEKVNQNMNKLAALLAEKNIQLIYMPAVDKFDLYSDYLLDQVYTHSVFFEKLRTLPKDYILVDTKEILAAEVAKGEKDIFWPDDTHWSWKASRAIAESLSFEKQE